VNKYHLDLVNWSEVAKVAEMVESGRMESSEMKFGPLKVTIYPVRAEYTLRIDFKDENN